MVQTIGGTYPSGTTNTLQNERIVINGLSYRIRLLSGADHDPHQPIGGDTYGRNLESANNSEWDRLMYRLSIDNPYGTSENFENYSLSDLGLQPTSILNWTYNRSSNNASYRICRGDGNIDGFRNYGVTSSTATFVW